MHAVTKDHINPDATCTSLEQRIEENLEILIDCNRRLRSWFLSGKTRRYLKARREMAATRLAGMPR